MKILQPQKPSMTDKLVLKLSVRQKLWYVIAMVVYAIDKMLLSEESVFMEQFKAQLSIVFNSVC